MIETKLDLMEQMAQLLEETLRSLSASRMGTGWSADLTADVFVCVRIFFCLAARELVL